MPVDLLAERGTNERRDECAEVDAHVEDREAGIAARIVARVERADDRGDVRFQQPGADDDQTEAEIERGDARESHAAGDDDSADEHGAPVSEVAIGNEAAWDAHQIDEHCVEAIDLSGVFFTEAEAGLRDRADHVEEKQRAHPVIAEALPHFGEEAGEESAGMPEPFLTGRCGRRAHLVSPCATCIVANRSV